MTTMKARLVQMDPVLKKKLKNHLKRNEEKAPCLKHLDPQLKKSWKLKKPKKVRNLQKKKTAFIKS